MAFAIHDITDRCNDAGSVVEKEEEEDLVGYITAVIERRSEQLHADPSYLSPAVFNSDSLKGEHHTIELDRRPPAD